MVFDYIPPAEVFLGLGLAFVLALVALAVSTWLHRRNLRRVPLRIHVGGARGKTTTARLIGAGLRASGRRALVKTTGTRPRLILPDGEERDWRRWGAPTIAETTRFLRLARRLKVDAVVIESMAIEPEYLWASEAYLVRASHVALTNARPDHEEVLGHRANAMAEALALLAPTGGEIFLTAESDRPEIRAAATRRGSQIILTREQAPLPPEKANHALALSVCTALGISPAVAQDAFAGAGQDPGGFFGQEFGASDRQITFFNAFACNDIASFRQLWAAHAADPRPLVLLNARADRPERTRAFLDALPHLDRPVDLVMAGAWRRSWLRQAGFDPARVATLRTTTPPAAALEKLAARANGREIWGIGNYAGLGQAIADHLLVLPTPERAPPC